jgi:O-antigen/teichoic acid export membrane protein
LFDANVISPLTDYGRWIFLTALVTVAASFLTQVVISRQLGAFELGLYVLAAKLAYLPYEMANQVVGEVAFPLFARIQQDRVRVAAAFRSMLLGMITFLLPLYVLLISMAGWVVRDGLGERWTGTESLIQLLALVGIANLFGDACGPLFRGLGYPKWSTWVELLQSILVVGLLWGLTGQYGAPGAAVAWLIGVIVAQTLNFVLARRLVERPLAGTWRPILVVAAAAGAGAATTMPLGYLAPGLARLVAALLLAGAVTAIVVWTCDRRFKLGVGSILSHTFPRFARVVAPALSQ